VRVHTDLLSDCHSLNLWGKTIYCQKSSKQLSDLKTVTASSNVSFGRYNAKWGCRTGAVKTNIFRKYVSD